MARLSLNIPDAAERLAMKHGTFEEEHRSAARVWHGEIAGAIRNKCLGKPGIVTEESKPSTSMSPQLFDLTSLQRDANMSFGFSAKNTLGLAQALYEKHKVLTYPLSLIHIFMAIINTGFWWMANRCLIRTPLV